MYEDHQAGQRKGYDRHLIDVQRTLSVVEDSTCFIITVAAETGLQVEMAGLSSDVSAQLSLL